MMSFPLVLKKYATADLSTSPYVTNSDAATEYSSSHVTTKCGTISSNLFDESSSLIVYAANPSSTRATADQKRRYVRGCTDWRHELAFSFGCYGKSIVMP